ncbi:MAG: TIGR03936 family radical SAM-associated protein [Candidatus Omnitrophota bacterium]
MIRYDAIFEKKGAMVYISHLDLMTLFRRAMRRADLPYVLTRGFTPRVKISIPRALKLGRASDKEEMSLWLSGDRDEKEIAEAINRQLPEGIRILEILKSNEKERTIKK